MLGNVGRKNASSEREKVLLRLLLVSGNRSDVACPTDYSVHQLKQRLLNDWPKGRCHQGLEAINNSNNGQSGRVSRGQKI